MTTFESPCLRIEKVTNDDQASSNYIYVHTNLYSQFLSQNLLAGNREKDPIYISINKFVFRLKDDKTCPKDAFRIGGLQRDSIKLS